MCNDDVGARLLWRVLGVYGSGGLRWVSLFCWRVWWWWWCFGAGLCVVGDKCQTRRERQCRREFNGSTSSRTSSIGWP